MIYSSMELAIVTHIGYSPQYEFVVPILLSPEVKYQTHCDIVRGLQLG